MHKCLFHLTTFHKTGIAPRLYGCVDIGFKLETVPPKLR